MDSPVRNFLIPSSSEWLKKVTFEAQKVQYKNSKAYAYMLPNTNYIALLQRSTANDAYPYAHQSVYWDSCDTLLR